jgi:hypothetical protein
MKNSRCASNCGCERTNYNRRRFIQNSSFAAMGIFFLNSFKILKTEHGKYMDSFRPVGPASRYVPALKAAFIRRKEDYGILWPGAIYDGEAALKMYSEQFAQAARNIGIKFDLEGTPLYTPEEADVWLAESKSAGADGLVLILLDRQQHAWPTAKKVAGSGIPAVIFSPLGTSFTTNTEALAELPGSVIYSTNDFRQAEYGMKMLKAGTRMHHSRCVVIQGNKRYEQTLADTGITLQYIPAEVFMNEYKTLPVSREIEDMADEYIKQSRQIVKATRQDVINGIKSYKVAGNILEKENADAISMDCLGALGQTTISLPCIAWSRMNDDGIPAACEADTGAIVSHMMIQYLFDRPGFQQDPVADTSDDTLIGAHCSSPTRLNGFNTPPEPFDLVHHHGNRDAVPKTIWKVGQRITCLDFLPGNTANKTASELIISTGTVVDNMNAPPSGGCVVSIKVKMDDKHNVLSYPGFHQLFFYGDFRKELTEFAQLFKFKATVV